MSHPSAQGASSGHTFSSRPRSSPRSPSRGIHHTAADLPNRPRAFMPPSQTIAFKEMHSPKHAPRKFQTTRSPARQSAAVFFAIFICLVIFLFPHTDLATLQTLLSAQTLHAPNVTYLSREISDADAAASARRERPLPACAASGQRATTFLMIFMGHSGSSAILSELREHSQVHLEIPELVDHQDQFNTTDALRTIEQFFDRGMKFGKTPGFKIRPTHILNEPEAFRKLFDKYNTRIIWQYRQNLFKASVGEYANRYLNDTMNVEGLRENITMEERCKKGAGCHFPISNFTFLHHTLVLKVRSHHLITNAVYTATQGGRDCVREIPYEDYLYDRASVMHDLQRFLGLKYEQTAPLRFKATKDSMCDVVDNWGEVCRNFYGCLVWQPMLNDAKNKCFCPYASGTTKYCSAHESMLEE